MRRPSRLSSRSPPKRCASFALSWAKGDVPNVVNICARSPARYQLVVRHIDRVGVLANVLAVLKRDGINVEELSNTVFEGARAACAKIRLAARPTEACLAEIAAFKEEVLHIDPPTPAPPAVAPLHPP